MRGRREFLRRLALAPALLAPAGAAAKRDDRAERVVSVQVSPINGLAYYEGKRVLPALRVGDRLELRREPSNPHDERAVEIFWRKRKLGYLPRVQNVAVAHMMDQGERLSCAVVDLAPDDFPWQAVIVEVAWMPA